MKKEKRTILDFLKGLFRKETGEGVDSLTAPDEATVERLLNRALGETPPAVENSDEEEPKRSEAAADDDSGKNEDPDDSAEDRKELGDSDESGKAGGSDESGKAGDSDESGKDVGDKDEKSKKKESCPYATKRAIVESIEEVRRFAEEHKLAASVVRSLLTLLGEIALGALKGRVSRQILEALLKALNYEMAVENAFKKGRDDGRNELIEERYPAADDGLPHINGTLRCADTTSIFDVAAEARG